MKSSAMISTGSWRTMEQLDGGGGAYYWSMENFILLKMVGKTEPTLLCRLIRNQSLSTILSLKLKIKDQNTFMLLFTHTLQPVKPTKLIASNSSIVNM